MTETAHLILGAAIAAKVPNPLLAALLAISSHVLLDMVPHWDTGTNWRNRSMKKTIAYTVLDLAAGTAISLALFGNQVPLPYMAFIMFMATLPDWLEAPYFFGLKYPPFSTVYRLQHVFHKKKQLPWGLATQIAFIAVLLFAVAISPTLTALAK